jgi:hypothetical protein
MYRFHAMSLVAWLAAKQYMQTFYKELIAANRININTTINQATAIKTHIHDNTAISTINSAPFLQSIILK